MRKLLVGVLGSVVIALVALVALWRRGPSEEEQQQARLGLLRPTTGALVVKSVPPGAEIFIDGHKQEERTPGLVRNLTSGTHVVEVQLEGYRVRQDSVAVAAGETKEKIFALERLTGTLSVQSTPPGAQVLLNGEDKGTTPLGLELPTEQYALEVTKTGYVAHRQGVTVAQDEVEEVYIDLIARVGNLAIVSDPPSAVILLDGQEQGQGRQRQKHFFHDTPRAGKRITFAYFFLSTHSCHMALERSSSRALRTTSSCCCISRLR